MIIADDSRRDSLNDVLMDVLVCPRDQADLRHEGNELVCIRCGKRYPIEDGVPNMLIDRE